MFFFNWLVHFLFLELSIISYGDITMRSWPANSIGPGQTVRVCRMCLALYWWQRLIIFSSSRIRLFCKHVEMTSDLKIYTSYVWEYTVQDPKHAQYHKKTIILVFVTCLKSIIIQKHFSNDVQILLYLKACMERRKIVNGVLLTLSLLAAIVTSLCHQYRTRPVWTSVQSEQALYCWLTIF